jgi:PhnB protein
MTARPAIGSLTPHIICRDCAAAIEFYKKAFGAEEMFRLPGKDGKLMHASIAINGNVVMMNDEFAECGALSPLTIGGTGTTLHLVVADADAALQRAVDAGARVIMPVAEQFWGDRYGLVEDPFGHRWSLATPVRQLTPQQIIDNMKKMEQSA